MRDEKNSLMREMPQGNENSAEEESSEKKTILYCFPREALGKKDIKEIKNILNENGYSLKSSDSEENNEKILIQKEKDNSDGMNVSEIID